MQLDNETIRTIIITCASLIVIIPILRLLRKGNISSLSASKEGIKVDLTPVNKRDETNYFLTKRINEIDKQLEYHCYKITSTYNKKITFLFLNKQTCFSTISSLANELKSTLYQALRENNFKEKLSKDNIDDYLIDKLQDMKHNFIETSTFLSNEDCVINRNIIMPDFTEKEPILKEIIKNWSDEIRNAVITACNKKIETYNEYITIFNSNGDKYFIQVINDCIQKNKNYITDLGGTIHD